MGALFYRVFLDRSFVPFPFPSSFIHPTGHASFGHVSFLLPHGSGPLPWKWRLREETNSEPLADREDSGNKNTRGSKHSSWGFLGVVITITTPFTTTSDSRTPRPPPDPSLPFPSPSLSFSACNLFFIFLPWLKSAFTPRACNPADRSITIGVRALLQAVISKICRKRESFYNPLRETNRNQ